MEFTDHIAFPELTAVATHDETATFADLVNRQSRFVFRVAYSVLRNAHDAEDVVQDLFFKLHRSGAWQHMEDERAFLAKSAWRMAVDRIPKLRAVASPERTVPSHEKAVIDGELQGTVHRLIDALPEDLRQSLVLSTIEELTSREVAMVLGIPEGTVRNRVMRARQILKEKLTARLEIRHD
jgi:RNA polymerase sigma-70 factor (ECF subfamily)